MAHEHDDDVVMSNASPSSTAPAAAAAAAAPASTMMDVDNDVDMSSSQAAPAPAPKRTLGSLADYEVGRTLRETLLGEVRYGRHKASGRLVVIKVFYNKLVHARVTRAGVPVAENALEEIQHHLAVSQPPSSKFIARCLDLIQDAERIFVVVEYCAGGDFFGLVNSPAWTLDDGIRFTKQLFAGLYYLHSNGHFHMDLSLENLLLAHAPDGEQVLKICDFGVSVHCKRGTIMKNTDAARRPGKLRYMAPEVFALQPYSPARADVWSCGVIIFTFMTRAFPFNKPHMDDPCFRVVMEHGLNALLASTKRKLPDGCVDLLSHIFVPAERRASLEQIVTHSWLN